MRSMFRSSTARRLHLSAPIRSRWQPLDFATHTFPQNPPSDKIEEETIPKYQASLYYPVRIGEVLRDRYQIVNKLGFGSCSTVWLARDLSGKRHVALKLFVTSSSLGKHVDDEIDIYRRLGQQNWIHPGRDDVRHLEDTFDVNGPDGQHRCLVHRPLFENILAFLHRNPIARLPMPVMALTLKRLFLGLDFLHSECRVVHTDIKPDNLVLSLRDDNVFAAYEELELQYPSPRKVLDDRTIYWSRDVEFENLGEYLGTPVLCDFGSAVLGDVEHTEDVQPNVYRAPEVILDIPWSYNIDIWNVGCMIWDLFEGGQLFTGHDPELDRYRSRAHLAEMVALLGPPTLDFLAKSSSRGKFFDADGTFDAGIPLPDAVPLEQRETTLMDDPEDRQLFLQLMSKMLQWDPAKRYSAKALAEDEWIERHT